MAKINVLRKMKVDGKWGFYPVARVVERTRERFDFERVVQNGVPVVALSGTYYLEYRDPVRRRVAVGTHPRDVKAALATQGSVLDLRARGVQVEDAPQILARQHLRHTVAGKSIAEVVASFIEAPGLRYRSRSVAKYRNALEEFAQWCRKRYVAELGRDDVVAYMEHLVRVVGLQVSTAVDKGVIVASKMRQAGAAIGMRKGDWPMTTECEVEVYRPEVLQALFAAAREADYVLFQTFLLTGMRDQEVGFLSWSDFDAQRSTIRVTRKLALGFDPKNYQERTVPVPGVLVSLLVAHRERQAQSEQGPQHLIFATGTHNKQQGRQGGQRDRHMLARLKHLARSAGLNCGRCVAQRSRRSITCADAPICCEFFLHKFRHTYATTLLHDGVDLISLQQLLGHKDMESTRKYLKALRPVDLLAKINATSLATRFVR